MKRASILPAVPLRRVSHAHSLAAVPSRCAPGGGAGGAGGAAAAEVAAGGAGTSAVRLHRARRHRADDAGARLPAGGDLGVVVAGRALGAGGARVRAAAAATGSGGAAGAARG